MKLTKKSEALNIIEPSYLASLSALLWIALYYLPVGGALLRLVLPLPLIILHLRRGSRAALDGIIIQIFLLLILMGPVRGPLFLFPYGMLAFWLGRCWLKLRSWWYSWILGIIIGVIGFGIRVFALSTLVGENLWLIITRASYNLVDKLSSFLNISSTPSLFSIQVVAILLIVFQEVIYVLTIHIIAYSIFPRLNSRVPDPPLILEDFVNFKL
tara:strand:- start:253 stop:891 length:639 start_codon:yes stop_codon:yes gene_type:complete